MADAIKSALGFESELIAGAGGIFDVQVNGKLVFSKHAQGRFPEHDEILDLLRPAKVR